MNFPSRVARRDTGRQTDARVIWMERLLREKVAGG